MMSTVEFLIHDVHFDADVALVAGIVNKGEIPIGISFVSIRSKSEARAIQLAVEKIITYRREIDKLPTGMSGELHLKGEGADLLKKNDILEV